MASTHLSNLLGRFRIETSNPTGARIGDMYFDPNQHYLMYYTGNNWIGVLFT